MWQHRGKHLSPDNPISCLHNSMNVYQKDNFIWQKPESASKFNMKIIKTQHLQQISISQLASCTILTLVSLSFVYTSQKQLANWSLPMGRPLILNLSLTSTRWGELKLKTFIHNYSCKILFFPFLDWTITTKDCNLCIDLPLIKINYVNRTKTGQIKTSVNKTHLNIYEQYNWNIVIFPYKFDNWFLYIHCIV